VNNAPFPDVEVATRHNNTLDTDAALHAEDEHMSILTRLFGGKGKTATEEAYEWKNSELGLYFTLRSDDPVWKAIRHTSLSLFSRGS